MIPLKQSIIADDGTPLHLRTWNSPERPARALFCIHHGLGEHGGRYQPLAEFLTSQGCDVVAADARGHGRSGGPRCFAASYERLFEDWRRVLQLSLRTRDSAPRPLIVIGHSWGGALVTSWLLREPSLRPAAAVVTGPLFRPANPPPQWKVALGKVMSRFAPRTLLKTEVQPELLSRDPAVGEAFLADELCQAVVSARLGDLMLAEGEWLMKQAAAKTPLHTPLLVMHGTDDAITSCSASQQFVEQLGPPAELITWPGARHELFLETNREEIWNAMFPWVLSQMTPTAHGV